VVLPAAARPTALPIERSRLSQNEQELEDKKEKIRQIADFLVSENKGITKKQEQAVDVVMTVIGKQINPDAFYFETWTDDDVDTLFNLRQRNKWPHIGETGYSNVFVDMQTFRDAKKAKLTREIIDNLDLRLKHLRIKDIESLKKQYARFLKRTRGGRKTARKRRKTKRRKPTRQTRLRRHLVEFKKRLPA